MVSCSVGSTGMSSVLTAGMHTEGELAGEVGVAAHCVPESCCWSAQGQGRRVVTGRTGAGMSVPLMCSSLLNDHMSVALVLKGPKLP